MSDETRYVDPDAWFERLYDTALPDTHAADPDAVEDQAEDDTPVDLAKDDPDDEDQAEDDETEGELPPLPEPDGQGGDEPQTVGPSGWWRRSRTPVEPEPEPEASDEGVEVPGMPRFRIVPAAEATTEPLARPGHGDAHWAARLAARRRWAAYNATAAGLGWSTDLVHHAGQWIELGTHNPAGTAAVLLAGAGGIAAWWLSGRVRVLPYPYVARPLATAFAATYCSEQATALVTLMARHHVPVTPTVPLAAGLGLVAALRYLDQYSRAWWPPLAWVARAPLAAAVLALLIYPTTW